VDLHSDSNSERFELLLEATGAGYWELRRDGGASIVSDRSLEIFGVDGPVGNNAVATIRSCVDAPDLLRLDAAARAAEHTGTSYEEVIRVTRQVDGVRRWMRVRGRTFIGDNGSRRLLGTVVDITDEYTLQRRMERLRLQLEDAERLAGIGSWSWSVSTGEVRWSKETYRLLRMPSDTPPTFDLVLGLAVDDRHREKFLHHVTAALESGEPYDVEIPARLGDGSLAVLHSRGRVEHDPAGAPARMIGTMQDVTAVRSAERALIEREARFRTLAESSPTGVFLTDRSGVPTYVNERLLDWFDQTFEQFVALEWLKRVHPEDLPAVIAANQRSVGTADPFDAEYRILVRGETHWMRVRTQPLISTDGIVMGHVGSVLDTTEQHHADEERAQLQARLRQAQKLESIGLLAGGVAHDFNNLLVGVLANASLARTEAPLGGSLAEMLGDIEVAAQRASDLTQQLMAYGGRIDGDTETVDLVELSKQLPGLLRSQPTADVTIETSTEADQLPVDGDQTQLRRVVMNLLTNALDAVTAHPSSSGGRVTIHTRQEYLSSEQLSRCILGHDRAAGEYASVTVSDSGAGMSSDVLERMFDPFFTTKSSGRGLGLSATLGILNMHRGAIDVRSAPGFGTTIRVLLPLSRAAAPVRKTIELPDQEWRGVGTVLVVDDEATVRTAARRTLERAGFAVIEACDGEDALKKIDSFQDAVACILLDLSMPVMSGDRCLEALRSRGVDTPVLMSSGFDAAGVIHEIVARGDARFLKKPYSTSDLQRAIRETMLTQ
jgi:PAS domain S-box-containing protein